MDSVLMVVLNWNGMADTRACLVSLSKQSYKNVTILLVDNGSVEPGTDEELRNLSQLYGNKLVVVRNAVNEGFAGGVNTGITYGIKNNFDYVALFNNDAVAQPDWLEKLMSATEANDSWLTTGLLLHEDGKTIDSTGDWYSIWGLPFPRGRGENTGKAPASGEVFGGSGGATLYKTELFRKIGLFDETFFAYYEDADISFRALLSGYPTFYEKQAVAFHKRGASSDKVPGFAVRQTMKNLPMLFIKNVPSPFLLTIGVRFYTAYTLILGKALLSGGFKPAIIGYLQGVWLFWTHALPARRSIQTARTISNEELNRHLWHDLPPDQTGLRKLFRKTQD